jgi:hypothetical protein
MNPLLMEFREWAGFLCFQWHFRVSFWQLKVEARDEFVIFADFRKSSLKKSQINLSREAFHLSGSARVLFLPRNTTCITKSSDFFHYFYIGNMFTLDANMFILLLHKLSSLVSFPVRPECHTNFNYLPFRCDSTWSDIERAQSKRHRQFPQGTFGILFHFMTRS